MSRLGFGLVVASASSCSVAFHAAQAVWCAPIQEEAERATTPGSGKQQGKTGGKDSGKEGKQPAAVNRQERRSFYSLRDVISNDVLPGEKGMKNAAVACGTGAMWYQHQLQELKHPHDGGGGAADSGLASATDAARVGDVLTAQDCTFVLLFSLLAFGVNWHICQAGVEMEEREESRWEQYGPVAWRLRRSDAAAAALKVITPSMVVIAALEPVVLEPLSRLMGLWPAVPAQSAAAPP